MTKVRAHEDVIVVETTPRLVHLVKQVPGARYHARTDAHGPGGHFVLPLTWAACVGLRGTHGSALEVDDTLRDWARRELEDRVRPVMELRDRLELPEGELLPEWAQGLRPYQQVAVVLLSLAGSALLGDEMRLGKTVEIIAVARLMEWRPALFVVPNSTKFQWLAELEKWWPDASPVVIRGSAKERRDAINLLVNDEADVGIINWEALRLHSKLRGYASVVALQRCPAHGGTALLDPTTGETIEVTPGRCEAHPRELNDVHFELVVADEVHRAAHPRAKQTRALWAVGWEAPHRIGATGTPVLDSPEDLWAEMHWVWPEEWPTKTVFLERYGQTGWNTMGMLEVVGLRGDTRDELFSFLDPRFLRRTRRVTMPWLPEKIITRRPVEMTARQARAYREMKKEMLTELDDGGLTYVTNALAKLTRLRQFASAYARLEDGKLLLDEPSCKVDALLEIAEELGGQPAVVFAESRQLIQLAGARLEKARFDVGYIVGGVPDTERARFVREFQDGDLNFILVTLGAGGEGITLDRADVAIFLQRSFSMAKNAQAEDRIVGQGAGPGLEIIDIIARGTVDERVLEVEAEKREVSEEICRDRATYLRLLGDA